VLPAWCANVAPPTPEIVPIISRVRSIDAIDCLIVCSRWPVGLSCRAQLIVVSTGDVRESDLVFTAARSKPAAITGRHRRHRAAIHHAGPFDRDDAFDEIRPRVGDEPSERPRFGSVLTSRPVRIQLSFQPSISFTIFAQQKCLICGLLSISADQTIRVISIGVDLCECIHDEKRHTLILTRRAHGFTLNQYELRCLFVVRLITSIRLLWLASRAHRWKFRPIRPPPPKICFPTRGLTPSQIL
jgi:hypothetical protein